jgi:hypothetical protein
MTQFGKWIRERHLATGDNVAAAFRHAVAEADQATIVKRTPIEIAPGAIVAEIAMRESLAAKFRQSYEFSNRVRAAFADVGCDCELVTLWTLHVTIR